MTNSIIGKLSDDKYKITAYNKNLIEMEKLKGFLVVDIKKGSGFLGEDTGWTQYLGENDLLIKGGIFRGVEYLESIKYKKNLDNKYNNFVNPFYIFEILNDDGKAFFCNYYKDDINKILDDQEEKIKSINEKLEFEKSEFFEMHKFLDDLYFRR